MTFAANATPVHYVAIKMDVLPDDRRFALAIENIYVSKFVQ